MNKWQELTSFSYSLLLGQTQLKLPHNQSLCLHHSKFEILVFSIFTISAKLDPITYVGNLTNIHSISMNKQQKHFRLFKGASNCMIFEHVTTYAFLQNPICEIPAIG